MRRSLTLTPSLHTMTPHHTAQTRQVGGFLRPTHTQITTHTTTQTQYQIQTCTAHHILLASNTRTIKKYHDRGKENTIRNCTERSTIATYKTQWLDSVVAAVTTTLKPVAQRDRPGQHPSDTTTFITRLPIGTWETADRSGSRTSAISTETGRQ